jgi:hypothetical protein
LAFLVVSIQVVGHFELSSNQNFSMVRMSSAHILGMALSYFLAYDFDKSFLALVEMISSFFIPPTLVLSELFFEFATVLLVRTDSWKMSRFFSGLQKRGPPFLAINWA